MNFDSRLRRLEEKAGSGKCTCGSGPLVVWPDQADQVDATCPKCGRERVVLRVEYTAPGGPEGVKKALATLTPEIRKEQEALILAGKPSIILPRPEDNMSPPGVGLVEYHAGLRAKLAEKKRLT